MFAILVPACLVPIIGTLLWAQNKAKKEARIHYSRPSFARPEGMSWGQYINDFDVRSFSRTFGAATFKTMKEMDVGLWLRIGQADPSCSFLALSCLLLPWP